MGEHRGEAANNLPVGAAREIGAGDTASIAGGALGVVTWGGPEASPAERVFDRRVGVDNTRTS